MDYPERIKNAVTLLKGVSADISHEIGTINKRISEFDIKPVLTSAESNECEQLQSRVDELEEMQDTIDRALYWVDI